MWFLIDESLLGWMDRCYKYNMCVCNKRKSKSSLSLSLLAFKHCNHHQIYVAIDVILISSIHLKPFRILKWTWWVKNSRKKETSHIHLHREYYYLHESDASWNVVSVVVIIINSIICRPTWNFCSVDFSMFWYECLKKKK